MQTLGTEASAKFCTGHFQVRMSQSPSGSGSGNPAWDFQYLIPDYEVGRCYQMVMRAMYLPYQSPEQIERAVKPHRQALERR